jgi:hypothetical protein
MPDVKWDIRKNLGVLSEGGTWKKEVNIIAWNDKAAKMDIRSWDAEHKKMSKGITFTKEEVRKLKGLLDGLDVEKLEI